MIIIIIINKFNYKRISFPHEPRSRGKNFGQVSPPLIISQTWNIGAVPGSNPQNVHSICYYLVSIIRWFLSSFFLIFLHRFQFQDSLLENLRTEFGPEKSFFTKSINHVQQKVRERGGMTKILRCLFFFRRNIYSSKGSVGPFPSPLGVKNVKFQENSIILREDSR